jgi:hypothetical protein
MNQKTYNIQIQMTCQADCERMKQICIDNNLPIWDSEKAFYFVKGINNYFLYNSDYNFFAVFCLKEKFKEPITIPQFLEILNDK